MFKRATPETKQQLRDARANLADVSRGLREETDEYVAANQAVIDAEQAVRDSRKGS